MVADNAKIPAPANPISSTSPAGIRRREGPVHRRPLLRGAVQAMLLGGLAAAFGITRWIS